MFFIASIFYSCIEKSTVVDVSADSASFHIQTADSTKIFVWNADKKSLPKIGQQFEVDWFQKKWGPLMWLGYDKN